MLDGSTQHRMTFTFTIGIQKNPSQIFTISGPFPYRWPKYPESFSWSDSRLFRTLLGAKLSPWYPQCRSIDWIRNESSASSFLCSGFTFTDLVPIRQRSSRQLQSFYAVHPDPVRIFGAAFSFLRARSRPFPFLNDRISTRSESTWTTSVRQSYYGIRSNTSYKVNGRTAIVKTFKDLSPLPQQSYLVNIDGLDECHDKATQQSILRPDSCAKRLQFINYRSDFQLEVASNLIFVLALIRNLSIRSLTESSFNPRRDIQAFLRDGLAKLSAENSSIMSHVE